MAVRPRQQLLQPVGNTLREQAHQRGVHAVLVVGNSLTCHFWLNLLPLVRSARVQHFVTQDDLACVADRLHVRPTVVPSFLVVSEGFIVDWFPAPLPAAGEAAEPKALLSAVHERLQRYGGGA